MKKYLMAAAVALSLSSPAQACEVMGPAFDLLGIGLLALPFVLLLGVMAVQIGLRVWRKGTGDWSLSERF